MLKGRICKGPETGMSPMCLGIMNRPALQDAGTSWKRRKEF